MAVHVDEIHTQLRATTSGDGAPGGSSAAIPQSSDHGPGAQGHPGAGDDMWRRAEARVGQLRARVAAEGFDD